MQHLGWPRPRHLARPTSGHAIFAVGVASRGAKVLQRLTDARYDIEGVHSLVHILLPFPAEAVAVDPLQAGVNKAPSLSTAIFPLTCPEIYSNLISSGWPMGFCYF